jgi:hypothetical protein
MSDTKWIDEVKELEIETKSIDSILEEYLGSNWKKLDLASIKFLPYIKLQCNECLYISPDEVYTIHASETINSRGDSINFEPESRVAWALMALHQEGVHPVTREDENAKKNIAFRSQMMEVLTNPTLIKPEYKTINAKVAQPNYPKSSKGFAEVQINAGEYQSTSYGAPRRDYSELMRTLKFDIGIEAFDEHNADWHVVRRKIMDIKNPNGRK